MNRATAWVGSGVLCLAQVTQAHHSSAPHYDLDKQISVAGVVSKFEFVNPHAYVYFVAPEAAGQQQWRCELSARGFLGRMGWTATTLAVGDKLVFKGSPARREEHVCVLNSFVRADGVEVNTRANLLSANLQRPAAVVIASAATSSARSAATDATANLAGYWVSQEQGGRPGGRPGAQGMGGARPARYESSEAGVAAAKSYDQRFDDPALNCSIGNIIFGWTHDQNVNEIIQTGKTITLKYGYMDFVRTIHLDMSQHPKVITPSVGGHSIGHWQDGVLVVDTIGFKAGVLVPIGGIMHSGQLHIVERFAIDSGQTLTRSYQVEDPLYLKAAYSGSDVMQRSSEAYTPYSCVELSGKNNQRS